MLETIAVRTSCILARALRSPSIAKEFIRNDCEPFFIDELNSSMILTKAFQPTMRKKVIMDASRTMPFRCDRAIENELALTAKTIQVSSTIVNATYRFKGIINRSSDKDDGDNQTCVRFILQDFKFHLIHLNSKHFGCVVSKALTVINAIEMDVSAFHENALISSNSVSLVDFS